MTGFNTTDYAHLFYSFNVEERISMSLLLRRLDVRCRPGSLASRKSDQRR
jgi:hypothetical protein